MSIIALCSGNAYSFDFGQELGKALKENVQQKITENPDSFS